MAKKSKKGKKAQMKSKDDPYALDQGDVGMGISKMPGFAVLHTIKKNKKLRENGLLVNVEKTTKIKEQEFDKKKTGTFSFGLVVFPAEPFKALMPVIENNKYKKDLGEYVYKKGTYEDNMTIFLNLGKPIEDKKLKERGLDTEVTHYGIAPFMDSYSVLLFIMQSNGFLEDYDTERPFMFPEDLISEIENLDLILKVESFKNGKGVEKIRFKAEDIDFDELTGSDGSDDEEEEEEDDDDELDSDFDDDEDDEDE